MWALFLGLTPDDAGDLSLHFGRLDISIGDLTEDEPLTDEEVVGLSDLLRRRDLRLLYSLSPVAGAGVQDRNLGGFFKKIGRAISGTAKKIGSKVKDTISSVRRHTKEVLGERYLTSIFTAFGKQALTMIAGGKNQAAAMRMDVGLPPEYTPEELAKLSREMEEPPWYEGWPVMAGGAMVATMAVLGLAGVGETPMACACRVVFEWVAGRYGSERAARVKTTLEKLAALTAGYGRSDWATFLLPDFVADHRGTFGDMTLAQGDLNIFYQGLESTCLSGLGPTEAAATLFACTSTMDLPDAERRSAASAIISHFISRAYFTPTAGEKQQVGTKAAKFVKEYAAELKSQEKSWIEFFPGAVWERTREVAAEATGFGGDYWKYLKFAAYAAVPVVGYFGLKKLGLIGGASRGRPRLRRSV
jgi:hypothetical protein